MNIMRIFQFIPALIAVVIYIGVLVYIIWLFSRFVGAIERIANKIESSDKI